jgi:hypothetical protein
MRQVIGAYGLDEFINNEYVDWDEFVEKIIDDEEGELNQYEISALKILNDNQRRKKLIDKSLAKHKIPADMFAIAEGRGDSREYVIKQYGWKAVRNDHVETWTLMPKDIKEIADGLGEIIEQEGGSEEFDENEEFYVYVYSTKKNYTFTLPELENGGKPSQSPSTQYGNVANQQVKDIETQKLHPYYQQKSFQFGDSVSFKGWLLKERS